MQNNVPCIHVIITNVLRNIALLNHEVHCPFYEHTLQADNNQASLRVSIAHIRCKLVLTQTVQNMQGPGLLSYSWLSSHLGQAVKSQLLFAGGLKSLVSVCDFQHRNHSVLKSRELMAGVHGVTQDEHHLHTSEPQMSSQACMSLHLVAAAGLPTHSHESRQQIDVPKVTTSACRTCYI